MPADQRLCPFCDKSFVRPDVARKHAKICPSRDGRSLPPPARRGRKLHACDECSRSKASCDSGQPCKRCSLGNHTCTYRWRCDEAQPDSMTVAPVERRLSQGYRLTVSFLLDCSDTTLDATFRSIAYQLEPISAGYSDSSYLSQETHIMDTINPRFLSLDHFNPRVTEPWHPDNMICPENDELDFYTSISDTLSERMDFLLLSLQSHVVSNPLLSDDLNSLQLRGFFTTDNFRKLIHALHSQRFYHLPIIHWPTFRSETISLTLLLAAGMAGAAFLQRASQDSNIPTVVLPSSGLLETTEDYVFEELRRWSVSAEAPSTMHLGLELCQAALLTGTAVDFDNDEKTCERMANHRLPILVAALRTHGLPFARQAMSEYPTEWSRFIRKESWIRTVTWAFFSDSLKTMFYNIPPVLTMREMDISLPCSSGLWYAETLESFELLRRMEPLGLEPLSLSTVVEDLLGDEWDQKLACLRDRLSVPHLHAVIMSLHLVIFNFHATMMPKCCYPLLTRALDRWQTLWDFTQARVPQSEKKLLGVARHAHELAWLWRMIVKYSGGKTKCEVKYLKRNICYDTTDFSKFLQDIKS